MKRIDPYLQARALGFTEKDRNILIDLADDLIHERLPQEDWQMTCWSNVSAEIWKRGGRPYGAIWEGRIPTGSCLPAIPLS